MTFLIYQVAPLVEFCGKSNAMSCNHFKETSSYIQKIVEKIYPVIQYHFILIGSCNDHETKFSDDPFVSELWILIDELKSVFHTLIAYETTLVFPTILKYFNNKSEINHHLPDIHELIFMAKSKEKQLLRLSDEINARLRRFDITEFPQKENIQFIVSYFQNEFKKAKEKWNEMLDDRMNNCACFRIVPLSINTNLYNGPY